MLAFPGDVNRPKVAGCHALIRDGAILARDAADILTDLKIPAPPVARRPVRDTPRDPIERAVLRALEVDSAHLDLLVARVNAPPATVIAALSKLEIAGHVARDGINRFIISTPCNDSIAANANVSKPAEVRSLRGARQPERRKLTRMESYRPIK
ncbi:MAG: hypothetical protein NVS9B12_10560 [Vulcanimicrobiaceae bacterium]